jgi:tetratricopeptide (TPR) repeat protein
MMSVSSLNEEEPGEDAARSGTVEADSVERMCERATDMAYSGEPRQGLTLAFRARKLAQQRRNTHEELLALNAAAICQRLRGDVISAVAAAVDAHTLANRVGDRAMLYHALCTIGSSAFALDTLDEAARLLERCVEGAMAIGDPQLEIRARDELGVVWGDMKHFDLAQAELDRALKLVDQHNEHRHRARVLMRIGNLNKKQASAAKKAGREEEAEQFRQRCEHWAHRALDAAKGESAAYLRLNVLSMLGQLEIGRGDERAALEWLHQALGLAHRSSRRAPIPHLLTEIGKLEEARGDLNEARLAYEEAFAEADSMRPTWRLSEIGFLLADLEERSDNPDAAAKWREIAKNEQGQFEISRQQAKQQMSEMRKKLGPV